MSVEVNIAGSTENENLTNSPAKPFSQNLPLAFCWQRHENSISEDSTHVPPFRQGFGLQLPITIPTYEYLLTK